MKNYTVFIGGWEEGDEPDWVVMRVDNIPWNQAREILVRQLKLFADDDCDYCRGTALEDAAKLEAAITEGNFRTFVDGDDYLIIEYKP